MKKFTKYFLIVLLLASVATNIYLMRRIAWLDSAVTVLVEMVDEQEREIQIRKMVCDVNCR